MEITAKNYVLEPLTYNIFLIIHTLISEIHLFALGNDAKELLY